MPSTTRSKRSYHHGDLAPALVSAAVDVLEEEGLEGLSLRKVARRAEVSAAAPYHHFSDKRALLGAVAADGFQRLAQLEKERAEGVYDPDARMTALGTAYVLFAVRNPALFRLMFGGETVCDVEGTDALAASAESYALIEDAARARIETRGLAIDVSDYTLAAWSLVHGLAGLLVDSRTKFLSPDAKNSQEAEREIVRVVESVTAAFLGNVA